VIDKSAIDPNALHFYRMLKEAGFSAYFVGGSVRDLLLGKHPKDFDIATNATPHQIKRVIPQGRIIGRRFRHVMLERGGGRYEIVTFRGPVVQAEEDIAELDDESAENQPTAEAGQSAAEGAPQQDRRERRNYPDLNQFGNAEQDAIRRDFTINALFYDPDADELVDYVEGKLDVDRKIVRTIGDPMVRMEEDPIRILRAIRHKMKLGLEYDPALEAAMRDKSPLLNETSKDRIREEFLKVCNDHSLGDFLSEGRRLGLVPHIMPWLESVNDESVEQNFRLLDKFKEYPTPERLSPDMGLALMMIPLVEPLVLEPYKATLQPGDKNHLPDMKYFLSCEPLRNFYLRNLRISRAQTDHLVRALFYFSRMSGLWLEQGPPRRIIGRLFQHPPAVLAAKMARLALESEGKEVPDWMKELAEYEAGKRRHRGEREGQRDHGRDRDRGERGDRGPRESRGPRDSEDDQSDQAENFADRAEGESEEDSSEAKEPARGMRLPPPDQPMVWNGPLHAPVLRPVFNEEPTIRWSRKNQTVRAFRPSGIPNQPVDHSLLKSGLVYNYKPEIEGNGRSDEEGGGGGRDRGERGGRNRRDRGRNRGRDRGDRGERGDRGDRSENRGNEQRADRRDRNERNDRQDRGNRGRDRGERADRGDQQPNFNQADAGNQREQRNNNIENDIDEDSIGNVLRPGEQPAPLMGGNNFPDYGDDEDDADDNIGNRLDAPPTSGHVGMNGDGFLPPARRQQNNRGGQGGGGGGNNRRRGRRRGRRGGGSGGGPNRAPRGNHDTQ
jgi:tRNA nucleotidyltransferase/poly(A) polymerase